MPNWLNSTNNTAIQKWSSTFLRAWMQQEECNGKNVLQVDPKGRLGSSVQQQQITADKQWEKSFKTAQLMAYIDNTHWWWPMSLQNYFSNLCRLIKMKAPSHSPGGRGKNKTAVPGKPPKTQAFFCVIRLPLTFLEREANVSSPSSVSKWAQAGVTASTDPPEPPSESRWLQTTTHRHESLADGFPRVSTYILTVTRQAGAQSYPQGPSSCNQYLCSEGT